MTLCVEFELSILVDVLMFLGVPVLPLVVGVDINTRIVCVGPSTVRPLCVCIMCKSAK